MIHVQKRLYLFVFMLFFGVSNAIAESWDYFVSAGAFKVKSNAVELRKKLLEDWIGPPIALKRKGRLHVVFIGPFRSNIEAEQCQIKLDTMGYPSVMLRK